MPTRSCARLLGPLVLFACALPAQSPAGRWSGSIEVPAQALQVQVTLRESGGAWSGSIDIPAQGAKALPLVAITVDGRKAAFTIQGVPGEPTFEGELAADGTALAGTFTQGGAEFPFALRRAPAVSFDGVQAWLDKTRAAFHVPGCAAVVVAGDQVVATFASGLRDVEQQLPVTAETLFAIGSATKAFTTLLLATLVEEGKLAWDEPVRTWLPEFALMDAGAGERLTPRDLVTHRSGMPRHDLVWYGATFERADMVRRLRWLPLSEDLRTEFQYNNLMFLAAGHLAERITGATWEQLVRQRILQPLGMARSNFSVQESARDGDHAEPYRRDDAAPERIPFRDLAAIGPAGSINSSVAEMAHWVALQLGNGSHGGNAVVPPAAFADLHTVRMPVTGALGAATPEIVMVGYALGWIVDVYRGSRRVHHGGGIDGFTANVALLPDRGYGCVVLTNLGGTPLPEVVTRQLFDRVLEAPERDWAAEALVRVQRAEQQAGKGRAAAASERHEGTQPSHALADYAGDYEHPGYGGCRVALREGGLAIEFHGIGAGLEHWHYDVFRCRKEAAAPDLEGTLVQFTTDLDGDVDGLRAVLEPKTEPIRFARQTDARLRDPAFLATLAGDYELEGRVATVAVQGARLTLALPGQFHVLEPRRGTVFGIGKLSGYSVRFLLDEHGAPTGARFRQPEGVFAAVRKQSAAAK